ncbi:hypothetical protein F4818DRAFT_439427 [Hypoxylon cercidicola]|nr:hypothetical protein F4818DRAFT_439427 [Hypoxylon cercidicola]
MVFLSPYGDASNALALNYDFLTEVSPGVWKVSDKKTRTEWLAHDMTDSLTQDSFSPRLQNRTPFRTLLETEWNRVLSPMFTILSHDNLVRMKDWINVKKPLVGGNTEYRTYVVWDNCDAGVLGNLLVPPPVPVKTKKKYPDNDDDAVKVDDSEDEEYTLEPFMPESICWHVLLSIMKALAWLHDGSWEILYGNEGQFTMSPEPDWQPILHRNITPNNIFFQHPEVGEWYGPCKLGNYGNLYISGHHNGDGSKSKDRDFSKPLAPHPLSKFQPLEGLASADKDQGYTYPQLPDQPYTLISELRALGEIIQLMMLEPKSKHDLTIIRQQSVEENFWHTKYSPLLKNMVSMLMTYNPDEKLEDGTYALPTRECFTSMLCTQAYEKFRDWQQSGDPEGRKATIRESTIRKQQIDERTLLIVENIRNEALRKVQEKDDKVDMSSYEVPKPKPRSLDHLEMVNPAAPLPYIEPEFIGENEDGEEFTMTYIESLIKKEEE